MQDSIPIHRDTLKHWIYSNSDYFKVWVTMLARARYLLEPKKGLYQNINYTLNRGEFLFGRKKWSESTGVSEQQLRTLIKKLINEEMIKNVVTTSKFTIFLIVNYEKFNPPQADNEESLTFIRPLSDLCLTFNSEKSNHQTNQQQSEEIQGVEAMYQPSLQPPANQHPTSIQPPANQHLTTNKESNKKEKKAKTEKTNIYTPEFELFWAAYPELGYQNSKPQSFKNFTSLLKKKVSIDDLVQAAKNYSADCEAEDKTEYLYKASNFVGKAEYYKSYLPDTWIPVIPKQDSKGGSRFGANKQSTGKVQESNKYDAAKTGNFFK